MTKPTGKVIQVNCSRELWPTLGWSWGAHPCEILPYFELSEGRLLIADRTPLIASLVPSQKGLARGRPLKFKLVSSPQE
jgi:hypothetical protein